MLLLFLFYNKKGTLEFVVKEEFILVVYGNMVDMQKDRFFISRAKG